MIPRVVAIDGPAGSGKSTLAKALAARLRLPYVNTGSMYRALTAAALRAGISVEDPRGLVQLMSKLSFRIGVKESSLIVEGPFEAQSLEDPEVERAVSEAASHPEVRAIMRREQRRLGLAGAVMEGRDIGSEVFPDAPLKVFLKAEPSIRGLRRARDRDEPEANVARSLEDRDFRDAVVNPLEPQPGALVIDTTTTDPDEAVRLVVEAARERLG